MDVLDPALIQYLTEDEALLYEQALQQQEALESPLNYMVYVSGAERFRHVEYLDGIIMALIEKRLYAAGPGPHSVRDPKGTYRHPTTGEPIRRYLAVSEGPRHGKSYHVSEHLPAWFATTHPDDPIILASYEADFAAEWGGKARDHVEAHPEFGITVNKEKRASAKWLIKDHRGGMSCAGAMGPITGKGAKLLIVDDPIKNSDEAKSEVLRQKLYDWWMSTARTRLEPGGVAIVMMTRWHEDDLVGRLTAEQPDQWYIVNLPALSFTDTNEDGVSVDPETGRADPLGRGPGEALCPERFDVPALMEIRADAPQWFAAMYQGRPNIEGGGIFQDTFNYYELKGDTYFLRDRDGKTTVVAEKNCYRFQVADMAVSTKTQADYTVIGTFDVTPDKVLILRSVFRERLEGPDHEPTVRREYKKFSPRFVGVEDATYGKSLIQSLIRTGGMIVRRLNPWKDDKTSRAIDAGFMIQNGQFYLPREADWLATFKNELLKFPNAAHDDQVDIVSYAAQIWKDLPKRIAKAPSDGTMESKIAAYDKKRFAQRKNGFHPDLGRWN